MNKLEASNATVRERLRPMEYFAFINAFPERLEALVDKIIKSSNLQNYEVIRLYALKKQLNPTAISPIDDVYKQLQKRRPVVVVDSFARSYLKIFNLENIKQVIRTALRRYKSNESMVPPLESALVSSFETPELRQFWQKELNLQGLLSNKLFISAIFHLLGSKMFKMREPQIELVSYMYYFSGEMRHYVVKMLGLNIRLSKVLGPFYDSPKERVFPLLSDLASDRLIYREEQFQYSLLRLIEKLRLKYETDSSYDLLISRVFRQQLAHGNPDEFVLRFYRKHLDLLIERSLLDKKYLDAFQQHIKESNNPMDYVDRLKLLFYSKRAFQDENASNSITKVRQEVDSNDAYKYLRLVFNKAKPDCNLTAEYALTKDKILQLLSSCLPNHNIELILNELPIGSIKKWQFIRILKCLEVQRPSNRIFNWVLDHFEHLFSDLSDTEQNEVIRLFSKLNLKVQDALTMLSSTTKSLNFIWSCYNVNFVGEPFVNYLKRIQPVLQYILPTLQLGEKLRLLPDLLSAILISQSKDPEVVQLLEWTAKEYLTAIRLKAPKDARATLIIDLLRHVHPELGSTASKIKDMLRIDERQETLLSAYNKNCIPLLTDTVRRQLEQKGYFPSSKEKQQSNRPTYQQLKTFIRTDETLVLLPKCYSLYGQPDHYRGDFALLLLYIRKFINKGNRKIKVVNWEELATQPQKQQ